MIFRVSLCALLLFLSTTPTVLAAQLSLLPGVAVRFATVKEGKQVLGSRDEYARSLNGFNVSVRMRTTVPVTAEDYRRFAAGGVLSWTPEEKAAIASVVAEVRPELERLRLPLPPTVLLVKTDGREEANAPYTRLNAIILTEAVLSRKREVLKYVFVHELFHVLTRRNPSLRDRLYSVIGFRRCDVRLPEELERVRISNPDHPRYLHAVELSLPDGSSGEAVPVLHSKHPAFDPKIPGDFFQYMQFSLLLVERADGVCAPPRTGDGPVLLDPVSVPDYLEKVGRNTDYINSPEEILADNFTLLVLGLNDLPSPGVVEGIKKVLGRAGDGA